MWIHSFKLSCFLVIFISFVKSDDFQNYKNPPFFENRSVIVHLADMLYEDIGLECKYFLSKKTYAAVQVYITFLFYLSAPISRSLANAVDVNYLLFGTHIELIAGLSCLAQTDLELNLQFLCNYLMKFVPWLTS